MGVIADGLQSLKHGDFPTNRRLGDDSARLLALAGLLVVVFLPAAAWVALPQDEGSFATARIPEVVRIVGLSLVVLGLVGRLPRLLPVRPAWMLDAALSLVVIALGTVSCSLASDAMPPEPRPVLLVVVLLAGAAWEELFFRFFLQGVLTPFFDSKAVAVLVSSTLFGLCHWDSLAHVLSAFAVGLMLGTLYARRRSLLQVVVAHLGINLALFYADTLAFG